MSASMTVAADGDAFAIVSDQQRAEGDAVFGHEGVNGGTAGADASGEDLPPQAGQEFLGDILGAPGTAADRSTPEMLASAGYIVFDAVHAVMSASFRGDDTASSEIIESSDTTDGVGQSESLMGEAGLEVFAGGENLQRVDPELALADVDSSGDGSSKQPEVIVPYEGDDDVGPSEQCLDGDDLADAEMLLVLDTLLPADDPTPTNGTAPTDTDGRQRLAKEQYYQEQVVDFKATLQSADEADGEALTIRVGMLVGVAYLANEPNFDLKLFSVSNSVKCTKATLANPHLAIIKAAVPKTDEKLASKWGIGLAYAVRMCGGLDNLHDYLMSNSLESCVRAARAEKRPARPRFARPSAGQPAPLVIENAPPPPEGRVTLVVEVENGRAHFVSWDVPEDTEEPVASPEEPLIGDRSDGPCPAIAPDGLDAGTTPGVGHDAEETRYSGEDAAGETPDGMEVRAAA